MKKFLAAAAALALSTTAAFAADPLEGIWVTEVDDGSYAHINVAPCADKICGWIARTFNSEGEYESENKGKMLVINMVNVGGGKYEGNVWRPSNDKIYIGKMTLNGNEVDLAGCVLGGLVCASQHWTRLQ